MLAWHHSAAVNVNIPIHQILSWEFNKVLTLYSVAEVSIDTMENKTQIFKFEGNMLEN